MLAGIKKGKRKRKNSKNDSSSLSSSSDSQSKKKSTTQMLDAAVSGPVTVINNVTVMNGCGDTRNVNNRSSSGGISSDKKNRDAAAELRQMLAGIKAQNVVDNDDSNNNKNDNDNSGTSNNQNKNIEIKGKRSAVERFEQRRGSGKNGKNVKNGDAQQQQQQSGPGVDASESVLVMNNYSKQPQNLSKEDFRRGARKGKIKQKELYMHASADKTISQMVEEEKQSKQQTGGGGSSSSNMDEIFARNIARMGSKYKGNDFKMIAGSTAGADEDDGTSMNESMKMFSSVSNRLTDAERYNREMSRQLAHSRKTTSIANKCWWWIESETFQKHRLVSLGDHVSLILVPSHLQLVPSQCYLVPIKHSESFVSCEDEVWDEIQRFKTSIRNMFHQKEGLGVLFCETVLPTKSLWQTRMDVIPVPMNVEQDAEIFFKSALNEQAEEWGTHTKLLSTKGVGNGNGLRRTIPKGFSYFNIEWNGGGFAQIIETQSFPKDFGIDTIAGMMELDPMRFGRKQKASDYDKGAVMEFVKKWEPFDWTVALDGA